MKISLAKPAQGEDADVKLTFQSIDKEGVETTLVADMGTYPARGGKVRVLAKDPLRNIVFTTGTLIRVSGLSVRKAAGITVKQGPRNGGRVEPVSARTVIG